MMIGSVGFGIANERWFPRKISIKLFDGHQARMLWGIGQERDYDIPYFHLCKQKNILIELPEALPYRKSEHRVTSDEYYPERR